MRHFRRNAEDRLRRLERAARASGDPRDQLHYELALEQAGLLDVLEREIVARAKLSPAELFFFEHSGWSYPAGAPPHVQIRHRIQGARDSAEAERRVESRDDMEFLWEHELDWDMCECSPGATSCESAALVDLHQGGEEYLATLGCIDFAGDYTYRRVVQAELAIEAGVLDWEPCSRCTSVAPEGEASCGACGERFCRDCEMVGAHGGYHECEF
jgi:hypothetical protein